MPLPIPIGQLAESFGTHTCDEDVNIVDKLPLAFMPYTVYTIALKAHAIIKVLITEIETILWFFHIMSGMCMPESQTKNPVSIGNAACWQGYAALLGLGITRRRNQQTVQILSPYINIFARTLLAKELPTRV
jgi:hypothetical protein